MVEQEEAKEICRHVEGIAKRVNINLEQAYKVYKEQLVIADGYGDYLIMQKEKGFL